MSAGCVLVTGADGYLGRLVVRRYLEASDVDVLAYLRARSPTEVAAKRAVLDAVVHGHGGRVHHAGGDLASDDPFAAIGPARRARITHIVHAGAVTRFDVARERARQVNVAGTAAVLALAAACPRLDSVGLVSTIYSSGLRPGPVPEEAHDDRHGFANFYEWSKWEAERLVLARADELPWRILRVATVIADDDSGRVTQHNAIHQTLKLCFYGLLSLLPGAAGTPVYLVTADFVADAVVRLMAPGGTGGIYHLAHRAGDSLTLAEVLTLAFDVFEGADDFRKKRILRPLLADQESFDLLVQGVRDRKSVV